MAEKLTEYLDKHNKSLKNSFSKRIIDKLLETIPFLIEEEHFECAKRLLEIFWRPEHAVTGKKPVQTVGLDFRTVDRSWAGRF